MAREYTLLLMDTLLKFASREATFSFIKSLNPGKYIAYLDRYNCPISLQLKNEK